DGKSLASKVLRAVDAPDRVAIMRFVPEVAASSRVFQSFQTTMTFLTLVKLNNETWRVWGLGSGLCPAHDIVGDSTHRLCPSTSRGTEVLRGESGRFVWKLLPNHSSGRVLPWGRPSRHPSPLLPKSPAGTRGYGSNGGGCS